MAETISDSPITEHPVSRTCKKPKIADTTITTDEEEEDLTSRLPDAVICDILSYIPTREAVATSVLSKRWNQLWKSVPNLDFTVRYRPYSDSLVTEPHFMNFVDRVLSHNNISCVRKIHLCCSSDNCDISRVNLWISSITRRESKHFYLILPSSCLVENLDQSSRIYSFPDSFFTRKTLVYLRLENIVIKIPNSVNFPSLKDIDFIHVQFLDDDSVKNILSACPVLQRLYLSRGTWDNIQILYVCSSTLQYLSLHTLYCDNKASGYKVVIDAPNLSCLSITDDVDADYEIINLSSLVELYVGIQLDDERVIVPEPGDVYWDRLFEFFRKMSHITDMHISCGTMGTFLYTPLDNMPMFENLTCLKVQLNDGDSWVLLPHLFRRTPNLVTFVLDKEGIHPDCDWYTPDDMPRCLLSSLENVVCYGFDDCVAEMAMVIYFLEKALVLKTMVIQSSDLDLETQTNILKQLLMFPRSSSTCKVEYTNV